MCIFLTQMVVNSFKVHSNSKSFDAAVDLKFFNFSKVIVFCSVSKE